MVSNAHTMILCISRKKIIPIVRTSYTPNKIWTYLVYCDSIVTNRECVWASDW